MILVERWKGRTGVAESINFKRNSYTVKLDEGYWLPFFEHELSLENAQAEQHPKPPNSTNN